MSSLPSMWGGQTHSGVLERSELSQILEVSDFSSSEGFICTFASSPRPIGLPTTLFPNPPSSPSLFHLISFGRLSSLVEPSVPSWLDCQPSRCGSATSECASFSELESPLFALSFQNQVPDSASVSLVPLVLSLSSSIWGCAKVVNRLLSSLFRLAAHWRVNGMMISN